MLKKYVARSQVNLSLCLPGGGSAHVSFIPKTGGGSVYYTKDEATQWGLEHHAKYGRLFRLEGIIDEQPKAPAAKPEPEKTDTVRRLSFRNNEDAKDYLADKYGISRSRLRSRAQIEAAATGNGITIDWES